MTKMKWLVAGLLFFTQASAQVITSNDGYDKTAKNSFKTVYETNQYYNDLEESIELKYANLKVPVFEKMEGPQDSLWLIDEQISSLRELIRLEELGFIEWDRKADRKDENYQKERLAKQEFAKTEIEKMRDLIVVLEEKKPSFVRDLKAQELILDVINKEKEKELEKAKSERQVALSKMYKA